MNKIKWLLCLLLLFGCTHKSNKSAEALADYLVNCPEGTKYIYYDLNHDGQEELILNKGIVYYTDECHLYEIDIDNIKVGKHLFCIGNTYYSMKGISITKSKEVEEVTVLKWETLKVEMKDNC